MEYFLKASYILILRDRYLIGIKKKVRNGRKPGQINKNVNETINNRKKVFKLLKQEGSKKALKRL